MYVWRRRRFFGSVGSHAPQPKAGRGTPPDEPQPRMVNFNVMRGAVSRLPITQPAGTGAASRRGTLANSRKKFSVVSRAISSNETPRVSASTFAVSTT